MHCQLALPQLINSRFLEPEHLVHHLGNTFISMEFFPFQFIGKTPEIDATRRSISDWYANLAQLSQMLFILAIPFSKFAFAILFNYRFPGDNNSDHNVETGRIARQKPSQEGKELRFSRTSRNVESIMKVMKGYGTCEQWIFGLGWTAWLGFLCINDTAPGA
jgi:hypothetical protein